MNLIVAERFNVKYKEVPSSIEQINTFLQEIIALNDLVIYHNNMINFEEIEFADIIELSKERLQKEIISNRLSPQSKKIARFILEHHDLSHDYIRIEIII